MVYNYKRAQLVADGVIRRRGRKGALVRGGVARPITVALINYTPREILSGLGSAIDQRAIVSAVGLTIEPDNEVDHLVTYKIGTTNVIDGEYKIVAPPTKLAPAGIVVYWDLQVRK